MLEPVAEQRGGATAPPCLPGHSCEKFKSGEKLVEGGGG